MYLEVCEQFHTGDIIDAVQDFVLGRVDGVNRAFAPSAPQFAAHVRKLEADRNKYRALDHGARLQIAARDKDADFAALKTPEVIARVKSMVDGFVGKDEAKKEKTPAEIEADKAYVRRHDAAFADEYVEYEGRKISKRLIRNLGRDDQVYSVGGSDDDEGNWGGST